MPTNPPKKSTNSINIIAGKYYPFVLEHFQAGGRSGIILKWDINNDGNVQVIPQLHFSQFDPDTPIIPEQNSWLMQYQNSDPSTTFANTMTMKSAVHDNDYL